MNDPRVKDIFEIVEAGERVQHRVREGPDFPPGAPTAGETRKGSQLVIQVWVSAGEEVGEMPDVTEQDGCGGQGTAQQAEGEI